MDLSHCAGLIIGPLAGLIFFCGVMAVVIGLWPVHVVVMFRSMAMYALLYNAMAYFLYLLSRWIVKGTAFVHDLEFYPKPT